MARELGIAPSAETRRLVAEVRGTGDGAVQSLPGTATPALPAAINRSYRSRLVGRRAVIERLDAAWELARRDATRFVLLCGEAGIGKTRVIAEFAAQVRAAGATVLYGRAPEEPLAPYQPFAEALRPLVAAGEPDEPALRAGPLAGELSRLLPDQAARLPSQADRSERDPEGARYRLFEAVGSLLAAAARSTPLLLVLDDLHWADRPTLLMLGHIARANPRSMLLIGAYREGELGRAGPLITTVADLRRDTPVERVLLGGLVQDQVRALAESWLGAGAEPGLIEALCDASGGNPLFIEELLRHLEERGGGAGDRPRSLTALGLPEGVKDVVRARLARLGPAAQSLRLAAVAGREFELELLALVEGAGREELIESFDAALDAQLIRETERPGRYAFNHALVRDAIYTELSAARRALLHERIGVALEHGSEGQPYSRLPELAHHFLLAGPEMISKAVEYARLAARRTATQLAYESSATLYERALEALGPSAGGWRRERAELLLELGEALLRAGEVGASRERFSEAAALARELGEPQLLSRAALGRSGLSVTVLGVDPENVALLEEALSRVQSTDDALRAAHERVLEHPPARLGGYRNDQAGGLGSLEAF
jgi:predicted ATPase